MKFLQLLLNESLPEKQTYQVNAYWREVQVRKYLTAVVAGKHGAV